MLRRVFACFLLLFLASSSLLLLGTPCRAGDAGLLVEAVTAGSPAAKAGVKVGDRLMALDGRRLPSIAALEAAQENSVTKGDLLLRIGRGEEMVLFTVPHGALGIEARP